VLGPSNPRDIVGMAGDGVGDPWNTLASNAHRLWIPVARQATSGTDSLSRNIESLADLERTSLDYYATIRSIYRQRRAAEIKHEVSGLPNPNPMSGGDDSGPTPAITYTITPNQPQAPAK
jgi:phospholipid-binding lipoprotein MlaA